MGNIGFTEILLIIFILIFLFGGKKIPEIAKGFAEGIKSFKKGLKGDDNNDSPNKNSKGWVHCIKKIFLSS